MDAVRRVWWATVAVVGAVMVLIDGSGPPRWLIGSLLFYVGTRRYYDERASR